MLNFRNLILFIAAVMVTLTSWAVNPKYHIVKRGETIESISKLYDISTQELLNANPKAKELFFTGLRLMIPESSSKAIGLVDYDTPNTSDTIPRTKSTSYVSPTSASPLPEKETRLDRDVEYYGLVIDAAFDDFLKYGVNAGYSFSHNREEWKYFGFYFQSQFWIKYKPKFDVPSVNIALGPSYGIRISDDVSIILPVALRCDITYGTIEDENGKKKDKQTLAWGCQIAPMLKYKWFGIGITGFFGKGDPSFGLRIAFVK